MYNRKIPLNGAHATTALYVQLYFHVALISQRTQWVLPIDPGVLVKYFNYLKFECIIVCEQGKV